MSIPCRQRTDHSLTLSSWANNAVLTSLLTLFFDYWHCVDITTGTVAWLLTLCVDITTGILFLDCWHSLLASLLTFCSFTDMFCWRHYWHSFPWLLTHFVDITPETLFLDFWHNCWHNYWHSVPWLLILPWLLALFSWNNDSFPWLLALFSWNNDSFPWLMALFSWNNDSFPWLLALFSLTTDNLFCRLLA